ncbi:hypothetical protein [Jatrophihabitans endophyticus]|uniref:hypothetical protein n=1 Tax=Jatrophihabitans endophyticus TaxID=1206085 RepID=UPI0019DD326B|nr:hypothetical protein [Jatrophihabitans endophyticus]MBE7187026.1 hypothetical protein [Jatrophihabitans endophyticus]
MAATGVVMAGGVAAAQAAPARAAKLSYQNFIATAKVTSSTHKKLRVTVSSTKNKTGSLGVDVSISGGPEQHDWSFKIKRSALAVNSKHAGHLTVASSATHGYGTLKLTFSKRSNPKKHSCSGSSYNTQTALKVAGSVHFSTKSSGSGSWGKVSFGGSKKKPLSGALYAAYGSTTACGSYKEPCQAATGWDLYGNGSSLYGGTSGSKGFLGASKSAKLGSYGTRTDSVYLSVPKPVLSGSGAKATYKVTGKGQAHGTLTFAATSAPSSYKQTCYVKKKKSSENVANFYSSVHSHGFKVTEQVFGAFTIPTKDASFDKITTK